MKLEKKYLIYGIGLVLLTLIGVSLAYFATQIVGDKKQVSIGTGDLRVVFTDTDGSITGTDIEPGWSTTKTFSVENKTNSEYKYNIVIEDLVNTFKTTGFLVYKITSTSGYNMTEFKDAPKASTATDKTLAYNVTIPSKTTHNYTIEIRYNNSEDVDQSDDMNSILSGNIYITQGGYDLLGAILRDNPTISERTNFNVSNVSNTTGTIYKTNKTEDDNTLFYYSGNTENNWVKFGKETKNSCTYNGYKVAYLYDKDSFLLRDVETESECVDNNICIIESNFPVVGLTAEECTGMSGFTAGSSVCFTEDEEGWYFHDYNYHGGDGETICVEYNGQYFTMTEEDTKAIWEEELNKDIYWRIIRTNEDGSVRLLYAGTNHDTTNGYIGFSDFNKSLNEGSSSSLKGSFNQNFNESRYSGYMYGENASLADNRANTTSSTIKTYLDSWYQKNLLTNYDKYISKSAIYCNDRSIGSGVWDKSIYAFGFGVWTRLQENNMAPSYKCGANVTGGLFESTQAVEDKFSASTTGGGNGQLTYPIALMTADEVVFAGGLTQSGLAYPYTAWYSINSEGKGIIGGGTWTLMSPLAVVLGICDNSGMIVESPQNFAVRPVLSILPCAKVTGTGTPTDPYVINESASTCS